MVDETTATAPVGSPPMESWEHLQNWRAHHALFERISALIKQLNSDVGSPPRKLESKVIVDRVGSSDRVQFYLPGFAVAGEGRCICEASLEASHALEEILKAALEQCSWDVLPQPDRSFSSWIAALKTEMYMNLLSFIDRRIPLSEARQAREAESALSVAVS